jgi:hypothetical protein
MDHSFNKILVTISQYKAVFAQFTIGYSSSLIVGRRLLHLLLRLKDN